MSKYIDKDALVAKIDNLKHKMDDRYSYSHGWKDAFRMLEAELDTLEVKEVELTQETSNFIDTYYKDAKIGHKLSIRRAAKHFFELGLKAQKGE